MNREKNTKFRKFEAIQGTFSTKLSELLAKKPRGCLVCRLEATSNS